MSDVAVQLRPQHRSITGDTLQIIREHLERIRFGQIALTIHDGRVVQLDVTEKQRLT